MSVPKPIQVGELEYVEFEYEDLHGKRFGVMEITCERPQAGGDDRWRAYFRCPSRREHVVYDVSRPAVTLRLIARVSL